MNWADIAAVLPFYILFLIPENEKGNFGQVVGFAKAVRSLRVFKLSRQFEGSEVLSQAIAKSIGERQRVVKRRIVVFVHMSRIP